jgi:ubiquinone biosynthesis protein
MLRLVQIFYVFAVSLLFNQDKNIGGRLRMALERLGLVFVKIGQVLAARQFFSGSAQAELEKLWDTTQPLPFSVIKPIVERAVGEPISTYFNSFDEAAYASASIAQTHVAYRQGRKVMVKVRRPDVLGKMHQDIRIAKRLIWLGSLVSGRMWCIKSAGVPQQVETWLLQESDLRNEKKNAELFRAAYDTDRIVVPEVEFACEELLIEQFLEGVPCNRWDEAYRKDGYDPQESVRGFLPPTFGPPFRGIPVPVHGDPHPANLIIMTGGRMGIVDYGRVGIVTKQDLNLLNDAVFAVYASNPERATEALLRLGNFSFKSEKKRRAFEQDIARYVRECHSRPFDYWITEMSNIQMRHGVPTADTFTLIGCFGVLANRVAQMFFPGSSTIDLVGAEIRAGMRQQMLERFTNIDPFPLLYELSLRVQNAPRDAARVVQHPVDALAEVIETLVAPLRERQAA